jgi:hypothetical protein
MALKPRSIYGDKFAKRFLSKNSYRRLRRDAKHAATRLRRRNPDKLRVIEGWL